MTKAWFPFYIARRYLISKKSTNVINWISGISIFGITIGTMAMIIILAVFSGLEGLIQSMFSAFNPEIKLTAAQGKRFSLSEEEVQSLRNHPGIAHFSFTLEDNALVRYDRKEILVHVKGVDEQYREVSGLDTMLYQGDFVLRDEKEEFAVVGKGVAMNVSMGLNFITPLVIYYPKNEVNQWSLDRSINREIIYPSGLFELQNEIDYQYVVVPMSFARRLFEEEERLSAIEIKTKPDWATADVMEDLRESWGSEWVFKDRFQQQELLYKTVQSEKLISFIILAFVVFIATFNIIGSLTMLIIDKKRDVQSLLHLGADYSSIRKIFLYEGWLISLVGMLTGTLLGLLICYLQDRFGLVALSGQGGFIVDYYPVKVEWLDVLATMLTVSFIGFLAAWFPVRFLTRRYL